MDHALWEIDVFANMQKKKYLKQNSRRLKQLLLPLVPSPPIVALNQERDQGEDPRAGGKVDDLSQGESPSVTHLVMILFRLLEEMDVGSQSVVWVSCPRVSAPMVKTENQDAMLVFT